MERIKIVGKEKILECLKQERDPEVKVRLISLNLISSYSRSVKEASEAVGIPTRTIYEWIWAISRHHPEGRPGQAKEKPFWTTKEVRFLIRERFEIDISEDQGRRILREKLKMDFSKPYPEDDSDLNPIHLEEHKKSHFSKVDQAPR